MAAFVLPLLVVLQLVTATDAVAQSIYQPLGLQPGDQYRLAFLTAGTRDGVSGNIADYNAFVTNQANAVGSLVRDIDADWFAIASTSAVTAIQNTGTDPSAPGDTGVPIYLLDGAKRLVNNYDELWAVNASNHRLINPLNVTQYGVVVTESQSSAWTGSKEFGTPDIANGSLPLGSELPVAGYTIAINARWMSIGPRGGSPANSLLALYAVSSVLTAAPEPSSALMAAAGLALAGLRFKR